MSDRTVYTEAQAAWLDAHAQACALTQRYGHACDELLEDGDLRDRFDERRRQLDETCQWLETKIRGQDLLPHDINVDREDLARLADRFREWLDSERHDHLRNALAAREAELITCFDALAAHDRSEAIEQAADRARAMRTWLQS